MKNKSNFTTLDNEIEHVYQDDTLGGGFYIALALGVLTAVAVVGELTGFTDAFIQSFA